MLHYRWIINIFAIWSATFGKPKLRIFCHGSNWDHLVFNLSTHIHINCFRNSFQMWMLIKINSKIIYKWKWQSVELRPPFSDLHLTALSGLKILSDLYISKILPSHCISIEGKHSDKQTKTFSKRTAKNIWLINRMG